eukprot:TRINITY_DN16531_c0_g1_i2.p1 TRINITY_DN16531_c0_g1~~TRINITY_DN16531_c0_g1_i2.p1  ORF type:complete len:490 (+),score=140.60 TRINITY_DN16531_c0_g1_i2:39-1472(+)
MAMTADMREALQDALEYSAQQHRRISDTLARIEEQEARLKSTAEQWSLLDRALADAHKSASAGWAAADEDGDAELPLIHSVVHCEHPPHDVESSDPTCWCRWAVSDDGRWLRGSEVGAGNAARSLSVPPPPRPPVMVRAHEVLMVGPVRARVQESEQTAAGDRFAALRSAVPARVLRRACSLAQAHDARRLRSVHVSMRHRTAGTLENTGEQVWLAALRLADVFTAAALSATAVPPVIIELGAGAGLTAAALGAVGQAGAVLYLTDTYGGDEEWAAAVRENAASAAGVDVRMRHMDWSDDRTIPFPHHESDVQWRAFADGQPQGVPAWLRWNAEDLPSVRSCGCFVAADVMYSDAVTIAFAGIVRVALKSAPQPAVAVVTAEGRSSLSAVVQNEMPPPDEVWAREVQRLRVRELLPPDDEGGDGVRFADLFAAPPEQRSAATTLEAESLRCDWLPRFWGGLGAAQLEVWRVYQTAAG